MLSEKQSTPPLTETRYDNQALIEKIRDTNNHLSDQVADLKNKLKIVETKKHQEKNTLQQPSDLVNYNDVTVTRLLAKRFASQLNLENYRKSIHELQVALMTFSGLLLLVSVTWLFISNANFLANGDFAYNAGLFGGFLMLCSIFYALMKRIRFINALGRNETWYYAHLVCGIVGPLLIILHTTFQIKSINSAVAFFTMFVIMLSGMFGRYIFTIFSFKSHRLYQRIGKLELSLIRNLHQHQHTTTKPVKSSLTRFAVSGLKKPKYWFQNIPQMLKVPFYAISYHFTLQRELRRMFREIGKRNAWDKQTIKETLASNKRIARKYTFNILLLSLISMTQNLLQNWRMIHANLLYLLTLTATAHIVAVHMY